MGVPAVDKKKTRRWWRWLKRVLLAVFVLLVLAVVFHEPLLRWAVGYGGTKWAKVAGVTLTWQVEGSVLGDLKLSEIEASGAMVERATLGELTVEYDLWSAARTRNIDVVKRLAIKDMDAVLDLRKLPQMDVKVEKTAEARAGRPPPVVWPKVIDIENVNAVVTLADGRRVTVRGLSLRVGEGMPGIFQFAEFRMEPGELHVVDVKAAVEWGERTITISELNLPYGGKLKSLMVDLSKISEDAITVRSEAAIGKALARVDASASGLFAPPLKAVVDVKITELSSADLVAFKLPPGLAFEHVNLDLHAEGPENLSMHGEVSVAAVQAAGAMLDEVRVPIEVVNGHAKIPMLRLVRGTNRLEMSAEAELPADLTQWQKIAWKTHVEVLVRDVTELQAEAPPAKGTVALSVDAQGVGATPTSARGHVEGTELAFQAYKLPKLAADFAVNGKSATLTLPALSLGAGNTVALNAEMLMEDVIPLKVDWEVRVDDPAVLMQTVGLPPLERPLTAKITTAGKASMRMNDVMNLDAEMDLSVKEGRYDDAPLPTVEMQMAATKGTAVLKSCNIVWDVQNHILLAGRAKLAAPWSFVADGDIALPELKNLNELLLAFKAPPVQSGSLLAKLDVTGDVSPWRCEGRADLQAKAVQMKGMKEAANVELRTTFAGKTAELAKLEVVLGPWRLLTSGAVTDKVANLRELSFWQKGRQLMSGHVITPFNVTQTDVVDGMPLDVVLNARDLPVHEIAAAAGVKGLPSGILSAKVKMGGRLDAASAEVKINVRDVKAAWAPKSFKPAQIDFLATLKANKLVVDAKVVQAPLQPLTLKAEAPLVVSDLIKKPGTALDLPLRATVDMEESDLSFVREFAPNVVRSVPAKMRLNARVSGTVRAPLIDSIIQIDVPEVGFVSSDMPSVRDVKVHVRTHDRKATIENISALFAGGRLKMGGTIDATNLQDPRFDLRLEAGEALVYRDPTSSLRANANVKVEGTLKTARVSGLVEAVRGRVFREVNIMPNLFRMIPQGDKLPPPPPSTARIEQKLEVPALMKDWTFDLKVRTHDPVLIAGNLVNGAISADIALGGTGAAPRLTGFANVDRMLVRLPFSTMKITKGVVTMNPANPFAPQLDVRGESRVGLYDITLYVYGDATAPKTRFSSSPPLSEADVVTLLGTGMTFSGDSSQVASEAATRALFLFATETYRKIFNKKKTVDPDPPKLHLSFNPSGADRSNDSVQAMYEITPKVRFTGRFMQIGRVKALLGYVLRFGKAARAMDEEAPR
ncbi:MAG TPA: hypothetical protein DDZ88_25870 [Verrucomicrobiales bacterium]|nr:hypothetical protein [Verrucomicrobiales bacterium]